MRITQLTAKCVVLVHRSLVIAEGWREASPVPQSRLVSSAPFELAGVDNGWCWLHSLSTAAACLEAASAACGFGFDSGDAIAPQGRVSARIKVGATASAPRRGLQPAYRQPCSSVFSRVAPPAN